MWPDSTRMKFLHWLHGRAEHADLDRQYADVGCHEPEHISGRQFTAGDANVRDHAFVAIIMAVKDQCLPRRIGIAFGRRETLYNRLEPRLDMHPGLWLCPDHILFAAAD